MIVNIVLGTLFLGSTGIFLFLFLSKMPQLAAIPEYIIAERLHARSAKFRLFIFHFKSFFRERRYWEVILRITGKTLYRVHIVVLRMDNSLMAFLKKLRANGFANGNGTEAVGSHEYLINAQEKISMTNQKEIQEVRPRKRKFKIFKKDM